MPSPLRARALRTLAAVLLLVVLVSQSAGRFESSGEIPPGKLPTILLLSFGASLAFAIGLTA